MLPIPPNIPPIYIFYISKKTKNSVITFNHLLSSRSPIEEQSVLGMRMEQREERMTPEEESSRRG